MDFKRKNKDLKICTFFTSRKQVHESDFGCDRTDLVSVLVDRTE